MERVELGKTGISISPLGLGTWQWGDRIFWGYGATHTDIDLRAAFQAAVEGGIDFFDTAEIYGRGRSETLLGEYIKSLNSSTTTVVASKFMPFPWRWTKGTMESALRSSLRRLNMGRVDLYQIHWPLPPFPVSHWADALAGAVLSGVARAAGVSNFRRDQMMRSHEVLARRGVVLASNQVEYNLLNRRIEMNGVLAGCRELGISVIAYSPLAKGLLTGKYTPAHRPPGLRGHVASRQRLAAIQPLIGLMREIGAGHGSKTPAQVALNWTICKGTVPIPGAKNARQAGENAAAASWRLSEAELTALDDASQRIR